MNKEFRTADIITEEHPTDSTLLTVNGTAVVFEERTEICKIDGISYYEVIDKNAFDDVDLSDVCLRYNHNDSFSILARTRNNSLRLHVDGEGLHFSADIVDTQQGRDVYKLIAEGLVNACSFGFTVAEDKYDTTTRTRRILRFDKVFEISVCDMPAYDNTSVQISERGFFEAQHEMERKAGYEKRRKKLILQTF